MAKAMLSLGVRFASRRPLYHPFEEVLVETVWKFAISATVPSGLPVVPQPVPAPPQPGFVGWVQPRSWVPVPVVKGVPRFRPWPGIVTQFTPSRRPASVQVEGLMPVLMTPLPGKVRYVLAMGPPTVARASKAAVSYHPLACEGTLGGVRTVS